MTDRHKAAFPCARRYPAGAVVRVYGWAGQGRTSGECVISGFHSRLDRDGLGILFDGTRPVILAGHPSPAET